MSAKLERIGAELAKARARREQWAAKEAELEAQYKEQENQEICDITHAYHFTPDQLAEIFKMAKTMLPESTPMQNALEQMQQTNNLILNEEEYENNEE